MEHSIIYYPQETLTMRAKPITDFGNNLKNLLSDMQKLMLERKGVGIAAPQVNRSLRCFLVHHDDDILTFVNPEIVQVSSELVYGEEGCLSVPGVYADVGRANYVHIKAQDSQGKEFEMEAEHFFARVIQHEYDHLEGILFFEHLRGGVRRSLLRSYEKIRQQIDAGKYNPVRNKEDE